MANIIENINEIKRLYAKPGQATYPAMAKLLDDKVQVSYFIGELTTHFNAEWFVFAVNDGILSFSSIPAAVTIEDADGNVSQGFRNWEGIFAIVEAAKSLQHNPQLIPLVTSLIEKYIQMSFDNKADSKRNFTIDYHICRCIFYLPVDKITERHLAFVKDFGLARDRSILSREMTTTFFNKVIDHSNSLTYQLLEIFFSHVADQKRYRIGGIIDEHALESFVKNAPKKLFQRLGEDVVYWAVDKLRSLSNAQPLSFSKFELTSLQPDAQNHNETDFSFSLVRFVWQLLIRLDEEWLLTQLKVIINAKEPIFRRIAYLIMDLKYPVYQQLFWQQANPLNDMEAKLEIYRFINRHCEEFEKTEIKIITDWIDGLKVAALKEDSPERSTQRRAYQQLEWYLALEPIHYKYEDLLIRPYNELQTITKGELPSHPGYDSYFTMRHGGDYSQTNRILNRTVVDVLNILTNPGRWEGYNTYGLQQDLRDYVIASYTTVIDNLHKFEVIPVTFLYNFMDAFRTLAEKGVVFDLERFLAFIASLIDHRDDLWDKTDANRENSTAIGMIAWTLNAIAQKNDNQLKLSDIQPAIHSLIVMDEKFKVEFEWLNAEPVMDIINSTRGKIYDALFNYSLREVRLQPNTPPVWNTDVKEHLTKKLISRSATTEFYWSVGFHIPAISYMDMEWLVKHLNILLEYQEDGYDCPVFDGYLLMSTQLFTNLFELLYPTYLEQINMLTGDGTIVRRFVEHIWIAFAIELRGAKELIDALLKSANGNQFSFLIDRVSHDENNIKSEQIKYIWKHIVGAAENTESSFLKRQAFNTVNFADVIQNLDEECIALFLRSLSFGGANLNSYRLLRTIESKIKTEQFETAGRLLNALLELTSNDIFFDENQIIGIEKALYQRGFVELADTIAIASVYRRYFSLVNVYNDYHGEQNNNVSIIERQ